MTRLELIQRLRRQVYGGFPSDDASITDNLVNAWVSDGIGIAAKKNYTDNLQLEGISFVNNSYYSTFKGIEITEDENFLYKVLLPQIPIGIGQNEGISRVVFKNLQNTISYPMVILSENQVGIQRGMRPIPNKILGYPEGKNLFAITDIILTQYTATVTMISGGDSTDMGSELNVPSDSINVIVEYVKSQLAFQRMQPVDNTNDGVDAIKTT